MKWFAIVLMIFTSLPVYGSSLTDLKNLDLLKLQFNNDVGKVRLISLLSPT